MNVGVGCGGDSSMSVEKAGTAIIELVMMSARIILHPKYVHSVIGLIPKSSIRCRERHD